MKTFLFLYLTLGIFSISVHADNDPSLQEVLIDLCMLPLPTEQEICSSRLSWYGYDAETRRCRHFVYGCGERRRNIFSSIIMCRRLCENLLNWR
uniref:Kunitz-type serine protease inhibitor n=1 Tax=Argopecten irradians TaxID=31199 RepID=A1X863_ARGIR|nr:Kunitz-type serine protease inhibitor [Argopecten irradians]